MINRQIKAMDVDDGFLITLIVLTLVICMGFTVYSLYQKAPEPTASPYQMKPDDTVKSHLKKRVGKQNCTIELAWVARTPDGQVYIERVK